MEWWDRLKQRLLGATGKSDEPTNADAPTWILALCTGAGVSALRVMITDVRPSGLTFSSANGFRPDSAVTLSIPIGINFAARESQEFVRIKALVTRSLRAPVADREYVTDIRFNETTNARRDRWVESVIGAYGVTVPEASAATTGSERRGGARYATSLPVKVLLGDQRLGGYVRNLSVGGMLAVVDDDLPIDREIVLELSLPASRETLRVRGRVVHREAGVADAFCVIGVAFQSLTAPQGEVLTRSLMTLAREGN